MTTDIFDAAEKSGRLISFALRSKLSPTDDPDCLELIREFTANASAMQVLERMIRGLGLRLLEINIRVGLVVGSAHESPFEITRDDYHARMSASDRIIQGLIHLAIAAWCFPQAEDLEETNDTVPAQLTVEKLVEYIHGLCEEIQVRNENNLALPNAELRMAWQHVLALGKYADSAEGRVSFATLAGKVRYALTFLTTHGLLKRENQSGRESWLARPTFRIHVREYAGHQALSLITSAAKGVANG